MIRGAIGPPRRRRRLGLQLGVAFLCLAAHCSISGALANYVLEYSQAVTDASVSRAYARLAEANFFVLKTRFFGSRDFSLSLNYTRGYLQATTETKPHDDASSPVNRPLDVAADCPSAAAADFREKPMDTICATAASSTAGGGGGLRNASMPEDERRGFFCAGGALRRVFRHRASWRSMSARISGGSSESVCGSTSAPSMPVDEAPGEGGATGAGTGGAGRGAGALRFVRNELMSAWPAASIVLSVTPRLRIDSVAPCG